MPLIEHKWKAKSYIFLFRLPEGKNATDYTTDYTGFQRIEKFSK